MRPLAYVTAAVLALCYSGLVSAAPPPPPIPQAIFAPEAQIWYDNLPNSNLGDLLALNISVPGLSIGTICQVTTGESEINAAASITALALSPTFDLRKTYFLIAGIAGVNPKQATLGGVALARYAVQVALQHEFDAREMPEDFATGYVWYDTKGPYQYPTILYGTEVMEVNEALRGAAFDYAVQAKLADNEEAVAYRARYEPAGTDYAAAMKEPSVVKCDTATSDVYYSGTLLSEAFENVTRVWTNGTGVYCMTAQEDNATLEVLVRMAIRGIVDFARVLVMRTGSNFDRPPPNVTAYEHLLVLQQNGFPIAIDNIFRAGVEIVKGILADWDRVFDKGIKPTNYIGDIFGSLGGEPDFGPGSRTDGREGNT
ncbi:purine nucleoside permease [Achaetomium macrosporum]|uniref:Purine nucleoside permease n=1 Tax=Achaetomium macrosporum TaxID=79813 RepID=A0AAN7C844_9PEZI|nr:purine nucleoside permease [Achaetomium macrosporum]